MESEASHTVCKLNIPSHRAEPLSASPLTHHHPINQAHKVLALPAPAQGTACKSPIPTHLRPDPQVGKPKHAVTTSSVGGSVAQGCTT